MPTEPSPPLAPRWLRFGVLAGLGLTFLYPLVLVGCRQRVRDEPSLVREAASGFFDALLRGDAGRLERLITPPSAACRLGLGPFETTLRAEVGTPAIDEKPATGSYTDVQTATIPFTLSQQAQGEITSPKVKFANDESRERFLAADRTLRQRGEDGRWQPRTPAMAAGLADHVWSLREWVTFPACQRL
jgi:hypothetical protein